MHGVVDFARYATISWSTAKRSNNPSFLAYNLPVALVSGGPSWIGSARYDMVAEVPPVTPAAEGTSPMALARTLPMFQTLLTERFKLQFHREQTSMPVYNLVVAQSGLQIEEKAPQPPVCCLLPLSKLAAAPGDDSPGAKYDHGGVCLSSSARPGEQTGDR